MNIRRIGSGIYHKLLGSLGSERSKCELLKSGQLSDQAVRRLVFSASRELSQEAWKAINHQPKIIYNASERDAAGINRLSPGAELVLRQSEAESRTVARVLHYLYSPEQSEKSIDYLINLLQEHGKNKQGEILSELGRIDPVIVKIITNIFLRPERK